MKILLITGLFFLAAAAHASWINPAEASSNSGKVVGLAVPAAAEATGSSLADISLAESRVVSVNWQDVRPASSLGLTPGGGSGDSPIVNNPFIPEPGTVAAGVMMALALGGTVWRRYRA